MLGLTQKKSSVQVLQELQDKSGKIIEVFRDTAGTFEALSDQITDQIATIDLEITELTTAKAAALTQRDQNDSIASKIISFLND